uniref:uncharacterized protein DDB_G0285917-like n=1 Tax=Erigeron canadensis TaxID=72917 RepID=UPI001CB89373|nr:uncharacterized protein DDB_G0285917-like [Erigeron canadensis]
MEEQQPVLFPINVHHDGMFFFHPFRYSHGLQNPLQIRQFDTLQGLVHHIELEIGNPIEGLYYQLRPDNYVQNSQNNEPQKEIDLHDHENEDHETEKENNEESENNDNAENNEENENNEASENNENENNEESENNEEKENNEETSEGSRNPGDGDSDKDDDWDVADGDDESVASLDHLSEGENELREVRQGRPIAKMPKPSQLPKIDDYKSDLGHERSVIQEEYDEFLRDLVEAMNKKDGEEFQDPL